MCNTDRQRRCYPRIQACKQRCALGPWACVHSPQQPGPLRLSTKGRFFPCCACAISLSSPSLWVCLGIHYPPARCARSWNVLVSGYSNQQEALGKGLLSDQLGIPLWRSICRGHVSELQQYLAEVNEPMLTVHSAACMLTGGAICRVL